MNTCPKVCYLICSAPRSGSHLFSNMMVDAGLAGYPQEHFNPWHMGHAKGEFPEKLVYERAYVQELIEQYTTPNRVFGTKAQFSQIVSFVGLGRLESLFPTPLRYIYVQRLDDVREAISLARAMQTEQWEWGQPVEREPEYNHDQIVCCLEYVRVQKKGWETYFAERGSEPFRVIYEELVAAPERIVVEALKFLDVEIPKDFYVPPPRLRKQADHLSEEWANRFTAGVA